MSVCDFSARCDPKEDKLLNVSALRNSFIFWSERLGKPSTRQIIFEFLDKNPGATAAQILATISVEQQNSTKSQLSGLVQKGYVLRTGRQYALAKPYSSVRWSK